MVTNFADFLNEAAATVYSGGLSGVRVTGRMTITRKKSFVIAASMTSLRVVVVPSLGAKIPRPLSVQLTSGRVRLLLITIL